MTPRRVASVVGTLLVIGLVIPFVVFSVPGLVGADESYVVVSGSMEPDIGLGDAVIVEDVDPSSIDEGDVITFRVEGETYTTTHRVVEVTETAAGLEFMTKGDAVEERDPQAVPADAVVGTVLFTIPYLGYVVNFAQSGLGTVVLIGVPFGLLLVSELWSLLGDANGDGDQPASSATDGGTPQSGDASATVGVTYADLRLTLVVLVGFSAYALWQASRAPGSGLQVAVAVGATLGTVFAGAVAYATRPEGGHDEPTDRVVPGIVDPSPDPAWVENGEQSDEGEERPHAEPDASEGERR